MNEPPKKKKPTEQTFEEPKYLKQLVEQRTPVTVKMVDETLVTGLVEYFDASFIRITREGEPNLFLFKHHIKYMYEA